MEERQSTITPFRTAIILLVTVLCSSLIAYGVDASQSTLKEYTVFLSYLVTPVVATLVLVVYFLLNKGERQFKPLFARPNVLSLGLSVMAGVGVLCLLMIVNYVAGYIATAVEYPLSVVYPPLNNAWQWMLAVLCVCVVPAIVEEVLFRGVVLEAFLPYGDIPAILLSALTFALFHFNLAQSIYPFLYAIVLGLVVRKTGNIYYAMIMHFTNNLLTIIMSYFGWGEALAQFSWQNIGILAAIAVSGLAIFYTSYAFILKFSKENTLKKKDFSGIDDLKTFNLGSVFLVGIFAVLYICVIIGNRMAV